MCFSSLFSAKNNKIKIKKCLVLSNNLRVFIVECMIMNYLDNYCKYLWNCDIIICRLLFHYYGIIVQNSDIEELLLLKWKQSNYSIEWTRTFKTFSTKIFVLFFNQIDKSEKLHLLRNICFKDWFKHFTYWLTCHWISI